MNRSRAKAGRGAVTVAFAMALCSAWLLPAHALADGLPDLWFAGTRLILEHPQQRQGELAVATSDSGFARFLGVAGAAVAYQAGQNYIVVTTADRRTINFTLGDAQFTVNGVTQVAPFAPYLAGADVYVPFLALAKALYIDAIADGTTTVLEPELGALDVRPQGRVTVLTLRGGTALHYKRLSGPAQERVSLEFDGVGSTLERERKLGGSVRGLTINARGITRNPTTVVDINAAPGSVHALLSSDSRNTMSIAFAPAGVALGGSPIPDVGGAALASTRAAPSPPAPPVPVAPKFNPGAPLAAVTSPSASPASSPAALPLAPAVPAVPALITGFKTNATDDDGVNVDVAVSGNAAYEWHRLADNRWYVDLKPASLSIPAQDVPLRYQAMQSMRLKAFSGPSDHVPTVRIAFTLDSPRSVTLAQSAAGLTVQVGAVDDSTLARVGYGQLGSAAGVASASQGTAPGVLAAPPQVEATPAPESTWKFAPSAPYNARLIVIDPGHGGSDPGAAHNGLSEKDLNLDISNRLRDLLVSRGWIVKMTRRSDVDVYAPNDSARDELQARCDIANSAGARFFISVHTNSFTSSSQHGTTTYYYQAQAYGLAAAVHTRLAASLPTTDDGIIKSNFYVIHHTKMPSILIETAFLSNPTDAEYLHSNSFLQKIALGIADGVGDYAASPSQPVSATTSDTPNSL